MENNIIIESERILLRPWRLEDASSLFKYASDSRVSQLALWPAHTSVEMSREVIERYFKTNPYCFAMILKSSCEPVGCIGFVPQGQEHYPLEIDEREVGYWIGYPYWSHGLTTEALNVLIAWCKNYTDLKSLLLTTDAINTGSQRVAEKCGFQFLENYEFEGIMSTAYRLIL